MANDIKAKATEAVNTSGYPLELFVSSILTKHHHVAWNNEYFFDFAEQKARSVDIISPAFNHNMNNQVAFGSSVVIECKKSPQTAWVFFEAESVVQSEYSGQIFDYEQYAKGTYENESLIWKFNDKLSLHYGIRNGLSKVALNYQVVRIGEKDLDDSVKQLKAKDTIFEAANQVVKFITYWMAMGERNVLNRFLENGIYPVFNLDYPVIIYDGPLYNGYLKDDRIELEEREHIILKYQYQPPYVQKPKTFLLDVVKKDYFEKLLIILEKEQEIIAAHLDSNKDEFDAHAKTLQIPQWRHPKKQPFSK